jgi:adenosylcobinamide-GDP ribazoletransferase
MKLIKALKEGFGFLTMMPIGRTMDELPTHTYLFPFIGAIIGMIIGFLGLVFRSFMPAELSAVFIICSLYLLTGVQHFDGLVDFGDGFFAPRGKKSEAMRDVSVGAGGVIFGALALLLLFSSITYIMNLSTFTFFKIFLAAEVCAKSSMVTLIAFGKSTHDGMGKTFIDHAKKRDAVVSLAFTLVILLLAFRRFGLLFFIATVLLSFIILKIAKRNFGGVSGDVFGASNEITRAAFYAAAVIGINLIRLGLVRF